LADLGEPGAVAALLSLFTALPPRSLLVTALTPAEWRTLAREQENAAHPAVALLAELLEAADAAARPQPAPSALVSATIAGRATAAITLGLSDINQAKPLLDNLSDELGDATTTVTYQPEAALPLLLERSGARPVAVLSDNNIANFSSLRGYLRHLPELLSQCGVTPLALWSLEIFLNRKRVLTKVERAWHNDENTVSASQSNDGDLAHINRRVVFHGKENKDADSLPDLDDRPHFDSNDANLLRQKPPHYQ
jgi:hypothetical protein